MKVSLGWIGLLGMGLKGKTERDIFNIFLFFIFSSLIIPIILFHPSPNNLHFQTRQQRVSEVEKILHLISVCFGLPDQSLASPLIPFLIIAASIMKFV